MLKRVTHDFSSNFFCLAEPKNFAGEPFCAVFQKSSSSEKVCGQKGWGEYQDFASKIFCLTVPRNFVGQAFRVSPISVLEKFYASEGYVTIFCRNLLSHSAEKFRRGSLLCCVSESFW